MGSGWTCECSVGADELVPLMANFLVLAGISSPLERGLRRILKMVAPSGGFQLTPLAEEGLGVTATFCGL